jgi:hypothetical protein
LRCESRILNESEAKPKRSDSKSEKQVYGERKLCDPVILPATIPFLVFDGQTGLQFFLFSTEQNLNQPQSSHYNDENAKDSSVHESLTVIIAASLYLEPERQELVRRAESQSLDLRNGSRDSEKASTPAPMPPSSASFAEIVARFYAKPPSRGAAKLPTRFPNAVAAPAAPTRRAFASGR